MEKVLTGRREFLATGAAGFWLACLGRPVVALERPARPPLTMADSLVKTPAFTPVTAPPSEKARKGQRLFLETRQKDRQAILYEVDERGACMLAHLPDLEGYYRGERPTLEKMFEHVREAFPADEIDMQRERFLRFAQDAVAAGIAIRTDQHVYAVRRERTAP